MGRNEDFKAKLCEVVDNSFFLLSLFAVRCCDLGSATSVFSDQIMSIRINFGIVNESLLLMVFP